MPLRIGPRVFTSPGSALQELSTSCGSWFACATIAVPACCRTWARDRAAVSAAKSASWMRLRDAERFSLAVCRFSIVDEKRFCTAPSAARDESIVCSAASIEGAPRSIRRPSRCRSR